MNPPTFSALPNATSTSLGENDTSHLAKLLTPPSHSPLKYASGPKLAPLGTNPLELGLAQFHNFRLAGYLAPLGVNSRILLQSSLCGLSPSGLHRFTRRHTSNW